MRRPRWPAQRRHCCGEQRHAASWWKRPGCRHHSTLHVEFAADLAQLRSLVAELQREREELRSRRVAARTGGVAIPLS